MKNTFTLFFISCIILNLTVKSVFAESIVHTGISSVAGISQENPGSSENRQSYYFSDAYFVADNNSQQDPASAVKEKTDSSGIKIKVFPNPATDYIRIEWQAQLDTEMHAELYDLFGRRVSRTKSDGSSSHIQMDLQAYQRSAYLLKVFTGDSKFSRTYRIIKH